MDQRPKSSNFQGTETCGGGQKRRKQGRRERTRGNKTYSTSSEDWSLIAPTGTPLTSGTTPTALKIRPGYMVELVAINIRTCVHPSRTRMNVATILSRVAFSDPFVVEILDIWRVGNECELGIKSRVIVKRSFRFGVKGRSCDVKCRERGEFSGQQRYREWWRPRAEENKDESAHPAPNVYRTSHLAWFSTSMSSRESNRECGGRRSLEKVEDQ